MPSRGREPIVEAGNIGPQAAAQSHHSSISYLEVAADLQNLTRLCVIVPQEEEQAQCAMTRQTQSVR